MQETQPPPPASEPTPPPPQPTPIPIIFRDDFTGSLSSEWAWINEGPANWAITPEGWLQITATNPTILAGKPDIEQENILTYPAPDGDFVVTAHVRAEPRTNFHQATIFLIGDGANYVAVNTGFCQFCIPDTGGHGFFMEAIRNGVGTSDLPAAPRQPGTTDVYLRLVYSAANNSVTAFASYEPDVWQQVGRPVDAPPFESVGLGASNVPGPGGEPEVLIAFFDYFEVAAGETAVTAADALPSTMPTAAPPEPTPLPAGTLFRDEFNGPLLDGWTWINEESDRWSFTGDGMLEIVGGNPAFYSEGGYGLINFLTRELPEGDFAITTHVIADPNENFHQATIYIFEDASNYIALNTGFCGPCSVGGPGFFMETFIDNNPFGNAFMLPRDAGATDVYLRLVNQGGSVTGYYALEPGNWVEVGSFGNFFDFKLVGLGATNSGNPADDIVARFDYFEITEP
ncbi:MAG: hypothetical protein Kow00124_32380 [Anaerolineae bacterium]